jgi:hypothetical protein
MALVAPALVGGLMLYAGTKAQHPLPKWLLYLSGGAAIVSTGMATLALAGSRELELGLSGLG